MKLHANARTCPHSRRLAVDRVEQDGWTLAAAAEAAGVSVRTVSKWLRRYRCEGEQGLLDRSSAPRSVPSRTAEERVAVIAGVAAVADDGRRDRRDAGDAALDGLGDLDPDRAGQALAAGAARAARTATSSKRPGELVHVDVKKLGRIGRPGHRVNGDRRTRSRGIGWEYVHVAIDDATRLAYVEVLDDEKAVTAVGFLRRAVAHFAAYGIRVERLMTDNGPAYLSIVHALACKALGIKHLRTRPYRPRTNGKAERFIRTMLGGWAYGAIYRNSDERAQPSPAGSTSTIADDHTAASAAKPRSSAYRRSTGTTSSGPTLASG